MKGQRSIEVLGFKEKKEELAKGYGNICCICYTMYKN